MIQLFCGDDTRKSLAKFDKYVEAVKLKRPEASVFELTDDNFSQATLEELAQGQTLWFPRSLVVGRRLFEKEENSEILFDRLPSLAESESLFMFWEEGEDPKLVRSLKGLEQKIEIFELAVAKVKPGFNLFLLADAFTSRDRRGLWVGYNQALRAGAEAREVFNNLWWQLRVLLAVSGGGDLSGFKPFVIQKAKRGLGKFKENELEELAQKFGQINAEEYPNSDEFVFRLESLILSI